MRTKEKGEFTESKILSKFLELGWRVSLDGIPQNIARYVIKLGQKKFK